MVKKFKVTLVAELELPDEFECQIDPADGPLLTYKGECLMPIIQWLSGPLTVTPADAERPWDNLNDTTAMLLIDATQSEDCKIKQAKA